MKRSTIEWGAIVALCIAIASGLVWLGKLEGRLKAIEDGSNLKEEKQRILKDVDDLLFAKIIEFENKLREQNEKDTRASASPAEITFPINNDYLDENMIVRGKSRNIADGISLWIIVFAHKNKRYYLQKQPADIATDGDWSAPATYGTGYDAGKKFDTILVGINATKKEIFKTSTAYITGVEELKEIHETILIYDRIFGKRKGS